MITFNKSWDFSSIDVENCNSEKELRVYKNQNFDTISKLKLREQDKMHLFKRTRDLETENQLVKIRKAIISLTLLDSVIEQRMYEVSQNII